MKHTPEQQWSALSALYEEADALPAQALPAWLARLESTRNPLLPQLKRMLEARSHLETDNFLGTLPKLLPREAPPGSDWAPGRRVGPYRLVRPLGQGGMAEVWLADRDDGILKRQAAIKLPYPRAGGESFAVRFERERNIVATLRHPHIAALFDAGVTREGQAWLALEYVEGLPISAYCDEHRLTLRARVQLFRQVLLAVQHAHANLVIHRDLKPANILVTPQGEARLLDFGIAKLLEAEGDAIAETELTRQVGRSMTLRYASPEQLSGLPLTTACDVYSLGVVFYELMCGERPYETKSVSATQLEYAILEVDAKAPSRRHLTMSAAAARSTHVKALRRALAPELDAIALKCLAKKPPGRYSSVDALIADVDRWLAGEAVLARAPGAWYRFRKFAGRHRVGVGLGVAAVVTLAGVAALAVVMGMQAREESARAVAARDFMLSLFKRADQEKSRGAEITARELLETGRKDLLTRLSGQPALQAELLQGIANIQRDMGEHAHADNTYAESARIYRELGRSRESAQVHAARADNAVRMGNLPLADAELQQARMSARGAASDPEFALKLVEIEGWIAEGSGSPDRARTLFREAERLATQTYGPRHVRTLDALRALIRVERQFRNHDAALALQDRLEATAAAAGMDARDSAALQWERADLLYAAGRYSDGLAHVQAALPRCDASLGPNDEPCRRLFFNRMRLLTRLGWLPQARAEVPRLQALVDDTAAPLLQIEALLQMFRIESLAGPSARAHELLVRVRSFAESGNEVPVPAALKAKAMLALAEAQLIAGAPDEALRWIDRARSLQPAADGPPRVDVLDAVAQSLAGVALLERSQSDEAIGRMRRAQEEFEQIFGARHSLTRLFSLNIALALEAQGRTDEALAIVKRAEGALRSTLGGESPCFARVLRLKARLQGAALTGRGGPDAAERASSKLDFFS